MFPAHLLETPVGNVGKHVVMLRRQVAELSPKHSLTAGCGTQVIRPLMPCPQGCNVHIGGLQIRAFQNMSK